MKFQQLRKFLILINLMAEKRLSNGKQIVKITFQKVTKKLLSFVAGFFAFKVREKYNNSLLTITKNLSEIPQHGNQQLDSIITKRRFDNSITFMDANYKGNGFYIA